MALSKNNWLKLFGVLFGATIVAYLAQTIADSGTFIYKEVFHKIIIANFSYLIPFFIFNKRKCSREVLTWILLAVFGTVINTISITVYEGYFDYWANYANGILNFTELLQDYLKILVLRLLILVPIVSIIFLSTAISFYFILKLVDKVLTKLKSLHK